MSINIIAVIDRNRALGKQGKLLCHLPRDLEYFKRNTLHQAILMGRKTFESIGRALPGRENLVLTHKKNAIFSGCTTVHSFEESLCLVKTDLWIIGGAELYTQGLALADKLYLTQIHHEFDGADTFFPELDPNQWQKTSSEFHEVSEKNAYALTFEIYQPRKRRWMRSEIS